MIPIIISEDRDEAEIQVRGVANEFRQIIATLQAEYDLHGFEYIITDLLEGTPYIDKVDIVNGKIITKTGFNWEYVKRVGNRPAELIEGKGFSVKSVSAKKKGF